MTNFPTRQHWFDSIWPEGSSDQDADHRILVLVPPHGDLQLVSKAVKENPNHKYLLVVENFDTFSKQLPEEWLRMPPDGGIPPNVWVGALIETQKEADERMKRLVRIRARRLFIVLKANHMPDLDLRAGLVASRCSNCGRKEGYARLQRAKKCVSGDICSNATLDPQIHLVTGMGKVDIDGIAKTCSKYGVALWDGESLEVPE